MPCYDGGGGPEDVDACEWMSDPLPWYCSDPCDTGDSFIDNINIQQAMHEAWVNSYGPDHDPFNHDQRNETMYIATATSSGYEFTEIPPGSGSSSCHFSASGSIPTNAVALIHTHPYGHGDTINDPACQGTYNGNNVSSDDEELVQFIKEHEQLPPIPMYVIDKDKIRVILPSDPSQYSQTINRCGY